MQSLHDRLATILSRPLGSVYTAAVLYVCQRDQILVRLAVGMPDPDDQGATTEVDTPFDLASITKPFTASAVLRLVATGAMQLDAPVRIYLPDFSGEGRGKITIRHLLTHSSGMGSLVRMYGPDAAHGEPQDVVIRSRPTRAPGRHVLYSDVGFMLLGFAVEAVSGLPLRAAMQDLVLTPLRLGCVRYGPCPEAAATEYDPWRGRRIRGEVHDENAAVLGGASGHAGLFGTAGSVASLAMAYAAPRSGFLPHTLAAEAISQQIASDGERRGLGWKLRSSDPAVSESLFSPGTFGHYGFTGTAVWSDRELDLTVVLLTNRVYFGREPAGIIGLRRAVFEALTSTPPSAGFGVD